MGSFLSSSKDGTSVNRIEDVLANVPVEAAPIESVLVESASDPLLNQTINEPVANSIISIPCPCPPPDCPCPPPDCSCSCPSPSPSPYPSPNSFDMDISGYPVENMSVNVPLDEIIEDTVPVEVIESNVATSPSVVAAEVPVPVPVVHPTTEHSKKNKKHSK
jgi:hypothetical protein